MWPNIQVKCNRFPEKIGKDVFIIFLKYVFKYMFQGNFFSFKLFLVHK